MSAALSAFRAAAVQGPGGTLSSLFDAAVAQLDAGTLPLAPLPAAAPLLLRLAAAGGPAGPDCACGPPMAAGEASLEAAALPREGKGVGLLPSSGFLPTLL